MIAEPPIKVTTKSDEQQLLDAARYIEEHGWTRGRYWDIGGRVCLLGALAKVSDAVSEAWTTGTGVTTTSLDFGNFQGATDKLAKYLSFIQGDESDAIHEDEVIDWNDKPGRTVDEVLRALRAAAGAES